MTLTSRAVPMLLAAGVSALWFFAQGGFPLRSTDPPARRLSTLERMALPRLQSVHDDIQRLVSRRREIPPLEGLTDYRIICHAHADDSAHTGGTRPEMLADAHRAGVQVILLSDHFRPPRDFMDSWRGLHEGVLFIPGSEVRGFLIHPQRSVMNAMEQDRTAFLETVREGGGLAFLSHIEERPDHPMDRLDGMEIYNRHWDAKRDRMTLIALALKLTDPAGIAVLAEALDRFPDELLGAQIDYPADYLAKWDSETASRRLTGIAANDAHHNQVFIVKMIDPDTVILGTTIDADEKMQRISALVRPSIRDLTRGRRPGDVLVRLDFDPYFRSFRDVSTHVLADALTESSIRSALRTGRAYVAHDWMADPTGFQFLAEPGGHTGPALPGDEVTWSADLQIRARLPVPCERIRLLRNGSQVAAGSGYDFEWNVPAPGVYRLEGWLLLDREERCWIFSNPIYVR